MAEEWHLAFGRYLRTLRNRRGLSLQEVASLSQSFPDTLNKGYLSRCENGRQSLAFSKVIPLSKIYKVPADVLLERMELDLELDRVGGPETEGMGFAELTAAGREAMDAGRRWDAYGYLRDAVMHASSLPLQPRFRDLDEQSACAQMTCGTAAKSVGRYLFARYEFLYVLEIDALGPRLSPLLFDRLASVHHSIGDPDNARFFGDQAIAKAEAVEDHEFLGHICSNRGLQARADKRLEHAESLFERAYRIFRDADLPADCAVALNNLAQVHFENGRLRAARLSLEASLRTTRDLSAHRSRALAHVLLGEIEQLQGREEQATRHWKQAASTAKRVNDRVVRFKADFLLMKQAHRDGNQAVKRSIMRRLRKLVNFIPSDTEEVREFEEFVTSESAAS